MEHKIGKSLLLTWILALCGMPLFAQVHPRVLFVGNSYTQVNNLPQLVSNIALSMGDTMTYASNTPGGCTFEMHCHNQSMAMICEGGWDFVVLQEQSQLPAFPMDSVELYVFPFAQQLVDSIYAHNFCAEPMFYMTWGRKIGDTEFGYPPMDTYEGMDSLLYARYMQMGADNDASVCPVGRVWHYLRDHHAEIELYMSDESHPSLTGSYAAACAFYTMIFGRNPDNISYGAGLDENDVQAIHSAVHEVVYDSLWKWRRPLPQAGFVVDSVDFLNVRFVNKAKLFEEQKWLFGDGETLHTDDTIVWHTFPESGIYLVKQVVSRHCMADTTFRFVRVEAPSVGMDEEKGLSISISPNPADDEVVLHLPEGIKAEAVLYSINGQEMWRKNIENPCNTITLQGFPSGLYVLKVITSQGVTMRRIIKR
ncbi:MAG: T9SS type A sorting domain-containing protein [Bacteroidales bacterium]|nr:T9SS type A sorting domain-containing protein [Bacteroidales bacterium]